MAILLDAFIELFDDLSEISSSLLVVFFKKLIEIFYNFLLQLLIIPDRLTTILVKVLTDELFEASDLRFHNINVIPGFTLVHGCEPTHLLFD